CTPPHATDLDSFTVTWTVTPQDTRATREIASAELASVGPVGAPVTLATYQAAQPITITAVIQDGMATGTSEPIPVGAYSVCLNPVLTGPNSETFSIADDDLCSVVQLTVDGVAGDGAAFGIVVGDDPVVTPTDPVDPDEPGTAPGEDIGADDGSTGGNTGSNDDTAAEN